METNKLEKMFDLQAKSQKDRGVLIKIKKYGLQPYINQMLLACYEEVTEVMKETKYKHKDLPFGWKKNLVMNDKQFKEELIDLWHFMMNLWLCVGGTSKEFFEMYRDKNKENYKRFYGDY